MVSIGCMPSNVCLCPAALRGLIEIKHVTDLAEPPRGERCV
jgi:hypothetical protein